MTTATAAQNDLAVVQGGFEAFAKGDVAAFGAMFHSDATWNHRNDDRWGGVHAGRDDILAFIAESGRVTEGTLCATPEAVIADGQGRVTVVVRMTGTRPDGRSFEDTQIMRFAVDGDYVRHADQFVGDPSAVKAFWA